MTLLSFSYGMIWFNRQTRNMSSQISVIDQRRNCSTFLPCSVPFSLDVNGCAGNPARLRYDASQWERTVRRGRTSHHHQQAFWWDCRAAPLGLRCPPHFLYLFLWGTGHFTRLKQFTEKLPCRFCGKSVRTSVANEETWFLGREEGLPGCPYFQPALKLTLLWCSRLANKLAENVFRN